VFAATIIFLPIMVWPLNSALIQLEENIGYTFTGSSALALSVVNVCTGYILFFVLVGGIYWTLIRSKAENSGMEY
jgi:ABC-type molybdate transport system permease subunit